MNQIMPPPRSAARIFDPALLALPLYDGHHRALASRLASWVADRRDIVTALIAQDPAPAGRQLIKLLAADGWLDVATGYQNGSYRPDFRAICLCREAFASLADLCDFAFSIQSLTAYALSSADAGASHAAALEALRTGAAIGALAISEPDTGSDMSAVATTAATVPGGYRLTGEKTWIAHAGIAEVILVLARTGGPGALGLSLFALTGEAARHTAATPIDLIAPRAIGTLRFETLFVPAAALVGAAGLGFVHATDTLEKFRLTVGAAANGFARQAFDEAVRFTRLRQVAGQSLARTQVTRCKLADMSCAINTSALLTLQAAYETDLGAPAAAIRSSMAKLVATESAQRVIDQAVQLLGARGIVAGSVTERLYRQIRGLRLYEGTSEIQRLIIGAAAVAGGI